MNSEGSAPYREHVLLTALGVQARDTEYKIGEHRARAVLAPLALLQLLKPERRPNRVLAVVTEGAKASPAWESLVKGVHQVLGCEPDAISIFDGRDEVEIREIVECIARRVPDDIDLTIDVTQGLRHFPFVAYALALYLRSLRSVCVRGVYYGMLEGIPPGEAHPIVNLQPLLELPDWFYAVRVFNETGATAPMAQLARPIAERLRARASSAGNDGALHREATEAQRFLSRLDQLGFAYGAGLPLEAGKAATLLQAANDRHTIPPSLTPRLPLGDELSQTLREAVAPCSFANTLVWKGHWKTNIVLDMAELERQAAMIDTMLERNQLAIAIGLMEEWVVSWVIHHNSSAADWLSFKGVRRQASSRLGALAAYVAEGGADVSEDQILWGEFWNRLTDLRNTLHHHGMREKAMESRPDSLQTVVVFWNRIRVGQVSLPKLGGGCGRLLISPQGTRPGVLYSAIKAASAERCLAVCSPLSERSVEEAASRADFTGSIAKLVVQDAHGGYNEVAPSVTKARAWLLEADEIVANLTGGTTMMSVLVQQLVEAAVRLDRRCRRFVLIDRRPPGEQDAHPFVPSEHNWLGVAEGDCHAHD